ncbi:helix-turn-helix domain-containing protein [Muriicola sp.]|uniref:helix-turn-helix domain-containing protein n=1 Tax=Muriicola sp. TaxID=2020856 RepID=UPI003C73402D
MNSSLNCKEVPMIFNSPELFVEAFEKMGYHLKMLQSDTGAFLGKFSLKIIDDFVFCYSYFNIKLVEYGINPSNYYVIYFAYSPLMTTFNTNKMDGYCVAVLPPDMEYYSCIDRMEYYAILVPIKDFDQILNFCFQLDANYFKQLILKQISLQRFLIYQSLFKEIIKTKDLQGSLVKEKISYLLTILIDDLISNRIDFQSVNKFNFNKQKLISQFIDYVHSHVDGELKLVDISEKLQINIRTLQRSCQDYLGLSPNQYIQILRVNLLREYLNSKQPGQSTIKQAAYTYGFSNLGRMASVYYNLFNEYPLQTLNKKPLVSDKKLLIQDFL